MITSGSRIDPKAPRQIHLSPAFAMPADDTVTETIGVIGQRGMGKTHTAMVLCEEMLRHSLPVCVIDPLGVCWGLRLDASGTKPSKLSVVIFGGDRGDVPLEVGAGAVVADFIVEERRPCIVDLSHFRKGEQTRFMTAFAERLYERKARNREPLHIVCDEADEFAPQNAMPEGKRLLGAMEDLVRRGRSRGIGLTLITQRPAVVNKNVLTQIGCMVVHRLTAPQDRKAVEDWIRASDCAEDRRAKMLASLATLAKGEAWFWSPGWLDAFERIQVAKRTTFDSSATPKMGDRVQAVAALGPVEIEALKTRIADTIERAKQDDPKALRAEIAALKKQVDGAPIALPPPPVVTAEQVDAMREAFESLAARVGSAQSELIRWAAEFGAAVEKFRSTLREMSARVAAGTPAPAASRKPYRIIVPHAPHAPHAPVAPQIARAPKPKRAAGEAFDVSQIGDGHRAVLRTLLALKEPLDRSSVAIRALIFPTSGGFSQHLADLRKLGFLEPGTGLALSAEGRAFAETLPHVAAPSTAPQLVEAWVRRVRTHLGPTQARIIEVLDEAGKPLDRSSIADLIPCTRTSGGYSQALADLRKRGIIEGSSESNDLHPELR